jgi:uncharacterized protein
MKKVKKEGKILTVIFIILLILVGILLIFYGFFYKPQSKEVVYKFSTLSPDVTVRSIKVPAVNKEGNGVMTEIIVEAMPGVGRTLVDINNLLFWADTQESIRKAREVAANYTGIDLNNYDLIYHIYANASIVGGPSAGASLTAVTIAAILKKEIRQDVMVTGVINYDGTIGPVGDILEKAKIAKQNNANVFLVPLTQSKEVRYEEKKVCRKFGNVEYCTIEQIPVVINIKDAVGIEVIEVRDINEVLSYLLI